MQRKRGELLTRPADTHGDWVLWSAGYDHGRLYVPPALAFELQAEHRARERERLAGEETELATRARGKEESAKGRHEEAPKAQAAPVGAHQAHLFEVHRHRVLVDVAGVSERLIRIKEGLYGDADHTTREVKALEAALQRGPLRSVVRPPHWRAALEDLAIETPAFRAVIELITNTFAVSEATRVPASVPPILIVGFPGAGKSYFCRRLAEVLGCGSAWLSVDQPTAGSDKHLARWCRSPTQRRIVRLANQTSALSEGDRHETVRGN